jgi:hypothetical protein
LCFKKNTRIPVKIPEIAIVKKIRVDMVGDSGKGSDGVDAGVDGVDAGN